MNRLLLYTTTATQLQLHYYSYTTMEGKRPAASSSALSEKKLRRLEKNRESARECRRRKKVRLRPLP